MTATTPLTAYGLLQDIRARPLPTQNSCTQATLYSTAGRPSSFAHMTEPILSTVWMDADTVFWDASKRSYLSPETRAMAQEAKAVAFKSPNGVLTSPVRANSSSSSSLLRILEAPATRVVSATATAFRPSSGIPPQDAFSGRSSCSTTYTASTTSRMSSVSSSDDCNDTKVFTRRRRRSLLLDMDVDMDENMDDTAREGTSKVSINVPQPYNFIIIPYLHTTTASARRVRPLDNSNNLRLRVTPPPPIDTKITKAYGEKLYNSCNPVHGTSTPDFDCDEEDEGMDIEAEMFKEIVLTPPGEETSDKHMPATPALFTVPLPSM